MKKESISKVITLLLILLFSYTTLSKLFDYPDFKVQIGHSELGGILSPGVEWIIPLSETIIVCLLIVKRWRMAGLYAACLFLVAAAIYIVIGLRNEVSLECACGGFLDEMPKPAHIIFNVFFAVSSAAAIGIRRIRPKYKNIP
jgi:hypothetical protein